jgi:O-antigen/teichoic acid export membrane protein
MTGQKPQIQDDRNSNIQKSVRGSVLLLSGRFVSIALNLITQLVTIRYLSKLDYGILAIGLILADYGAIIVAAGLDKSLSRFLPLYHEKRDLAQLRGALLFAVIVVLIFGALAFGVAFMLLRAGIGIDAASAPLVLLVILLAPLNAFERILEAFLATMGHSKAIASRRYLLRPLLKLSCVGLVILASGTVMQVAQAHLVAALTGALLYLWITGKAMARAGVFDRPLAIRFPIGDILAYGIPQHGSDLARSARGLMLPLILSGSAGPVALAAYAAILPFARLNDVVIDAFSILFTPVAARLHVAQQYQDINAHFWRTAAWIAVGTFPVFLMTCIFADEVVPLFLGERYADSSPILALVSLGIYVHALFGYNARMLRLEGHGKLVLYVDIVTSLAAIAACWVLVREYAAFGVAVASCASILLYSLLKSYLLLRTSKIISLDKPYLRLCMKAVFLSSLLLIVELLFQPAFPVCMLLSGLATIALVRMGRHVMQIDMVFSV